MTDWLWDYSDTLAPLLVLLLLLLRQQPLAGRSWLYAYLAMSVAVLGFSNYLADRKVNNMYLYHLYALIEVCLLLPYLEFVSRKSMRSSIWAIVLYVMYWTINFTRWEGMEQFNSNSASIAALLIICFSFLYFLRLVQQEEILRFQKLPSFWIVSGFLFYAVASILVLASYKYKDWFTDLNTHITWRMQQVANLVKFVLLSTGILCSYRQSSQDGSS